MRDKQVAGYTEYLFLLFDSFVSCGDESTAADNIGGFRDVLRKKSINFRVLHVILYRVITLSRSWLSETGQFLTLDSSFPTLVQAFCTSGLAESSFEWDVTS